MFRTARISVDDFNLEVEDIFLENMKLLNFQQSEVASKKKIVLKKEMFRQPNKDGFEILMYFLFNTLDKSKSEKVFKDCWMIYDQKQAAQFRRVCALWIEEIAEREKDTELPRKPGPILVSPYGRKFNELICHLSGYVLRQIGPPPLVSLPSSTKYEAIARKLQQTACKRNFEAHLKNVEDHKIWEEKYKEMIDYTLKSIDLIKKEKLEAKAKLESLRNEISSIKKPQNYAVSLSKLNKRWEFVHQSLKEVDEVSSMIPALLSDESNKVLDFKSITVEISETLLERAEEIGLTQEDIDELYDNEKNINLKSLVRIGNASLRSIFMDQRDASSSLDPLNEVTEVVEDHIKKHEAIREEMLQIIAKLLSLKKRLAMALEQLAEEPATMPSTSKQFNKYLVPATPTFSFSSREDSVEYDLQTPENRRKHNQNGKSYFKKFQGVEDECDLGATIETELTSLGINNDDMMMTHSRHIASSHVQTPPSIYVPWIRRTSGSNQSTPKENISINNSEPRTGYRSSTPCFNLGENLLNSSLTDLSPLPRSVDDINVEEETVAIVSKSQYSPMNLQQTTRLPGFRTRYSASVSDLALDSIAETSEQSFGLLSSYDLGTSAAGDDQWLN